MQKNTFINININFNKNTLQRKKQYSHFILCKIVKRKKNTKDDFNFSFHPPF